MFKRKDWSYYEDEACCKFYIENFIVSQSDMSLQEAVRILSSKIDRAKSSIRMKLQNIKQIVIEKGIVDSLNVSPLSNYSSQNLAAFENLMWFSPDFSIKNNILIRYNGNEEKVVVPKGIVRIGENAFVGCDIVKHIEIPEGCLEIDCSALDCKNLESVVLPSTLTKFDRHALRDQEADYIDEGDNFRDYHKISKEITIFSRSKRPVGEGKDIHIYQKSDESDAITNLRRCRYVVYFDYADFSGCTEEGLQWYKTSDGSITITGRIQKNEVYSWSRPSIIIPETINGLPVNRIGDNAFEREPINERTYSREYTDDELCGMAHGSDGSRYYTWTDYDETIVLSNNIKVLGVASFKHYNGEIELNNTIEIIGQEAFFQCNEKPMVKGEDFECLLRLPETVKIIERCAFVACNFSVLVPENIHYVGGFAFRDMGGTEGPWHHQYTHYPVVCFECSSVQSDEWDKDWKEGLELESIVWGASNIEEYEVEQPDNVLYAEGYGKIWLIITCDERMEAKVLIRDFQYIPVCF